MRSKARLFADLGFNSGAQEGVKQAFVRHLFKNAAASSAENISITSEQSARGEQLTFDPALLGAPTPRPDPKK